MPITKPSTNTLDFSKSHSKVGKLDTGLLSSESRNEVHQGWRQSIVALKPNRLELGTNLIHTLGVEALLND